MKNIILVARPYSGGFAVLAVDPLCPSNHETLAAGSELQEVLTDAARRSGLSLVIPITPTNDYYY